MYAIIYWVGEDRVYPYQTKDKQIKLFDTLKEADKEANDFEKSGLKVEARVICIEGVKE